MKHTTIPILFTFTFFFATNLIAQEFTFKKFNNLHSSCVYSIIINDKNEKIIGTPDDVLAIDHPQDTLVERVHNIGAYVLENDVNGKLWMGQVNNVLRDSDLIYSYVLSANPEHTFYSIETDENQLYIATKIGCLSFKKKETTNGNLFGKNPTIYRNTDLGCRRMNVLHLDSNNDVWMGADNALFKVDKLTGIPKKVKKINVTCMLNHENSLWVAGSDGIWKFENHKKWIRFMHHQNLTNHRIEKIIFDNKGRLWVGGNELFCCDDSECIEMTEKNGFDSKHVLSMAVDDQNIIWIGSSGKGLLYADLSDIEIDKPEEEKPVAIVEPVTEEVALPKTEKEIDLERRYDFMNGYAENNILLLIDVSNSMGKEKKLERLKASLKGLVDNMRPEDHLAIMLFTKNADLVLPKTPCTESQNIHNILDSLKTHGGSYLDNGVFMATELMQNNYLENGNNRIILATDGLFNISDDVYKIVKKTYKKDIILSVINFNQTDNSKLKLLTEKGGGNYWRINNTNTSLFRLLEKEVKGKRK